MEEEQEQRGQESLLVRKALKGAGRWARRAAKALVGQDGTGG